MALIRSKGARLLERWRGERSQKDAAIALGTDTATYNRFERGTRRPNAKTARRIEISTDGAVPFATWWQGMPREPTFHDVARTSAFLKHPDVAEIDSKHPVVYFVVRGDEIIYIGQSINVHTRLGSHARATKFDRAFTITVPSYDDLDDYEGAFIRAFLPRYCAASGGDSSRDEVILAKYGLKPIPGAQQFIMQRRRKPHQNAAIGRRDSP